MKTSKYSSKMKLFSVFILILVLTSGCLKWDPPDLRKIPGNAKEKREENVKEGKGFRINNVLKGNRGTGSFEFASSNEMWRASLELLDFTPLHNVDYSGGIIVTDWFTDENSKDSIKITIRFLSNEIRVDGIKVIIHKKICKNIDECKIIILKSTLSQEIKLAILRKAAKIKENEIIKEPDYKEPVRAKKNS